MKLISNCHRTCCVGLLILTVLLVAVNTSIASDVTVQITLKPSPVTIYQPLITVADVADIATIDPVLRTRINGLDLELLEEERSSIEITRSQVELRIRLSIDAAIRVHFRGPLKTLVHRSFVAAPEDVIKQSIIRAISSQFGLAVNDIHISLLDENRSPTAWIDLASSIERTLVVLPTTLPLGRTRVQMIYQGVQGGDKSMEVECRVTLMKELLVAQRHIAAGTILSDKDFQVVKRPLEDHLLRPANLEQAVGLTARTAIPIHAVIQVSDISTAAAGPLVRRNDLVDVLISRGGLKMRLKNARVLTPGAAGDTVQVVNPESKKTLTAAVVNKSLVEIR